MGFMPHSLEKGPIGLRLDYLAQFQSVRDDVRGRLNDYLETGSESYHPIAVMKSVQSNLPTSGLEVDVLDDSKSLFIKKLNYQLARERTIDPDWSHVGDGRHYVTHNSYLHEYNQDHAGNRVGFMGWWMGSRPANSGVFTDIASATVEAIDAGRPRLEFWWDCSLPHGATPTAEAVILDTIARVLFRTDHSAVTTTPLPPRDPLDEDPEDPDDEWSP